VDTFVNLSQGAERVDRIPPALSTGSAIARLVVTTFRQWSFQPRIRMSETDRHSGALVKKDGALARAVVSTAMAVAVYELRKALAEAAGDLPPRERDDERGRGESEHSPLGTAWKSASDARLPFAEDAAEAAGRWAAKNSPALIRDRLVPRFIDSFKAAS
jgi:hypothetical protein